MEAIKNYYSIMGSLLLLVLLSWVYGFRLNYFEQKETLLYLGYSGTGMILLSLAYSLRKRIWSRGGPLKYWLVMHRWTGLVGGIMITIHAGGRLYGSIAVVPLVLIAAIVLTGIFGYYFHWEIMRFSSRDPLAGKVGRSFVKYWLPVHIYLTLALLLAVPVHVYTALFYSGVK